ncbi:hypothetical protein G3480_13585 [Thiorhodococcus mannitoliphagus]|uniref:Uncharacterized protein n=1 Tax=Thiorhodococcus mannitoliphagus TaxID=329406 RepID=A0A6P1DWD2_9GAMM|nr:hypothetical protein [Thiorhodococcus mannitoliphagus]NEX21331.1 hypothetical protein [Thiorhodococcus mannitoliphagus]
MKTTTCAALTGAILLGTVACAQPPTPAADLGPMTYDASGTMPCSADEPSYDQACGWRVLRQADGSAEIWIANIAVSDRAAFRVLRFSDGEFTDRDGDPIQVAKDGDQWSISVGREHYRFADALITGG